MKAKFLLLTGPRKFESQLVELEARPERVIVDVTAWGICNSEMGDWKGMTSEYPRKLGHEWAGIAVQVGSNVVGVHEGDVVTGVGGVGLADFISVKGTDCFRLSPGIDPHYAMCEPLKCIVTVVRAAAPEAGDVGIVLGCGPMGLWCVQSLAGALLSSLIAVDIDESKLALAKKFGATHVVNPRTANGKAFIADASGGRMADFVIEGTGNTHVLNEAVTWLKRRRGRLTLMSMYKGGEPDFDFRAVMNKAVEVRGVFPAYATDERDDMTRAIALLERGVFNIKDLVSHRFSLDESGAGYAACENKSDNYLKGIIIP